ncbi:MAG: type transport system permease protein [Acidobacteriota bacterium]|jgi:ABC-2 type transport system permease protein|nr:type transport system permease protein [Acidobacteriota bacterium]
MSTQVLTGKTIEPGRRSLWRIYTLEAKYEFLKLLRMPAYVIPTLAFPLVFYMLFGVALKQGPSGFSFPTYLIATYGAFGVMNAALFGLGVGLAVERGQGWLLFKRATPMPPLAHYFGKLAMCILFGALMVGSLFALGATAGGVRLPLGTWLALAGVQIAGAVPFAAFGLAIGYWAGPNSAPAIINLISLPAAFGSGMWIPIQMMPGVVRKIAPFLPSYHFAQLALKTIGMDHGESVAQGVTVLAIFTLLSLGLAWAGWRRDEGKTYG